MVFENLLRLELTTEVVLSLCLSSSTLPSLMSSDQKLVFGYWDIRGLAAPTRMALHYAQIPYEDKLYVCTKKEDGGWTSGWGEEYSKMEATVHPFPNLPYMKLLDGTVIVQSRAIERYVGRLAKLDGATELEKVRCDEVIEQIADFRKELSTFNYSDKESFEANKKSMDEEVIPYFVKGFAEYLKRHNTPFIAGEHVTVADFDLYDVLDITEALSPKSVSQYAELAAFLKRVRELPQLQAYFDSPLSKLPPNNRMAYWGATPI
jgi:glutathione S-transferase